MVIIISPYYIVNVSQRIRFLLGSDKNNQLIFKSNRGTLYIVIGYRQNTNHHNKILDNPVVDNQYQSITLNLFFIGGLFILKLFKIATGNSSDLHNIHFEILDIDGNNIKFLSPLYIWMKSAE
jgi:hypothetical protein